MNRSGIVWIEEYNGRQSNLCASRLTAEGFRDALGAEPAFDPLSDDDATEVVFEGQGSKITEAQIVYFSGHANELGILLGVAKGKDDGIVKPKELRLGGNLAYLVLDCCKVLDPAFRKSWQGIFAGLHYIVGFSGFVQQCEHRGRIFAEALKHPKCPYPISEAWRKAAVETLGTEVPWCTIQATNGGMALDEFWSELQPITMIAAPSPGFVCRCERIAGLPELLAEEPAKGEVPLFRTDTNALSGPEIRSLGKQLGLGFGSVDQAVGGRREICNDEWRLSIYPHHRSFWVQPYRTREIQLFLDKAAAPPVPEVAMVKAQRHLKDLGLWDDRLTPRPMSATVELHGKAGPDPEGFELGKFSAVDARHVNYGFNLAGLPVLGPGAKVRVTFESSEASEVIFFWREPHQQNVSVPIITPDEARGRLESSHQFKNLPPGALQLEPGYRLGYFALPPGEHQDYLLPVYEFRGVVDAPAAIRYEFTRYVQAAKKEFRAGMPDGSVFRRPTVFA